MSTSIPSLRRVLADLRIPGAQTIAPLAADESIATFVLPGGEIAIEAWQKLRAALDQTGRWPIVCGDAKGMHRTEDMFELIKQTPAELLAQVPEGDALAALRKERDDENRRAMESLKANGVGIEEYQEMLKEEAEFAAARDEKCPWPAHPPATEFSIWATFDVLTRKPLDQVVIALLPTLRPADAPAYLRFGGYNACPRANMHVAVLRQWNAHFGAVPVAITHDIIECFVARPPQTQPEAEALAKDQESYCDDIVSQGTETVQRLAIDLWRSPHWYFWWD